MSLRRSLCLAVLPAFLLLSGCAALNQKEVAALQARQVRPDVIEKMRTSRPLVASDVIELTRRGVPEATIYDYVREVGVRYLMPKDDAIRMRAARVSPRIIDLMARESAKFAADYAATGSDYRAGFFYEPAAGPLLFDETYAPIY